MLIESVALPGRSVGVGRVRTVIVRLAEPEQTGGALRGLVEVLGRPPVPFSGADALLDLITAAAGGRVAGQVDAEDLDDGDPPP